MDELINFQSCNIGKQTFIDARQLLAQIEIIVSMRKW